MKLLYLKRKANIDSLTIRRFRKRRNAIEPIIGHMKSDHVVGRNWLKGDGGDRIDVLMAARGSNMKKFQRAFLCRLLRSLYCLDILLGKIFLQFTHDRLRYKLFFSDYV